MSEPLTARAAALVPEAATEPPCDELAVTQLARVMREAGGAPCWFQHQNDDLRKRLAEAEAELRDGDSWMERAKEFTAHGGCCECFTTDEAGHTERCRVGRLEALVARAIGLSLMHYENAVAAVTDDECETPLIHRVLNILALAKACHDKAEGRKAEAERLGVELDEARAAREKAETLLNAVGEALGIEAPALAHGFILAAAQEAVALRRVAEAAEALRIYDGESAGIYSSYANLGDDDLTQDAIELRDMWLRFTAALDAWAGATP